ncbi:unnamed protein product [Meloidogyne enterolobii]|uniref:Uncharacterized protein n=1 Tax=Meloidogyne enterolobii TaxID=390850 RepID=A0ACB0ZCZ0_MELEN
MFNILKKIAQTKFLPKVFNSFAMAYDVNMLVRPNVLGGLAGLSTKNNFLLFADANPTPASNGGTSVRYGYPYLDKGHTPVVQWAPVISAWSSLVGIVVCCLVVFLSAAIFFLKTMDKIANQQDEMKYDMKEGMKKIDNIEKMLKTKL